MAISQDQALFAAALDLLSRREHSCFELRQKLAGKFLDVEFESSFDNRFEAVLARLQSFNYQSDQRFAEAFTRSCIFRGKGPVRIRRDLQQRGITAEQITSALAQAEADWFVLAAEQLQRKFCSAINPALPREQQLKERVRRQRYLANRGFSADMIGCAIDSLNTAISVDR